MERKLVKAKDLKVGMNLASGDIVSRGPEVGFITPKGKVEIVLRGPGKSILHTWNKNTEIAILID